MEMTKYMWVLINGVWYLLKEEHNGEVLVESAEGKEFKFDVDEIKDSMLDIG